MAAQGAPSPHKHLFWEMGEQTAIRRGKWKLVLNGQLVEGAPPDDSVHLSDLSADMGEKRNLAGEFPEVAAELSAAAAEWRAGIESRWKTEWRAG